MAKFIQLNRSTDNAPVVINTDIITFIQEIAIHNRIGLLVCIYFTDGTSIKVSNSLQSVIDTLFIGES